MVDYEWEQMKLKIYWVRVLRVPEVQRYLEETTKRKCPECTKELEWNPQSHSISCSRCNFLISVDSLPMINRCLACGVALDDELQLCSIACRTQYDKTSATLKESAKDEIR